MKEPPPSLGGALGEIGVTCRMPLSVESHCAWHGLKFSVRVPKDFAHDEELRSKACDQGYVDPSFLIATDGSGWTVTSDSNDDTRAVAQALASTGLEVNLEGYCP